MASVVDIGVRVKERSSMASLDVEDIGDAPFSAM